MTSSVTQFFHVGVSLFIRPLSSLRALFSLPSLSGEAEEELSEELSGLYEKFKSLLPSGVLDAFSSAEGALGIKELLNVLFDPLSGFFSDIAASFALFISVALLFSLGELFLQGSGDTADSARAALSVILSLPLLSSLFKLIADCREGLCAGADFFARLIPIMTAVMATAGGASSAAVSASGMSLSLGFVADILTKNLFAVFGLIFALTIIGSIDTGRVTGGLSKSIRSLFGFLVGSASLIIGGTLALQTTITAAKDSLALRSARYAVSGMIPVVGGAVSGALSTLTSGIKILSGTVGALSAASVAVLMGAPLIALLLYRAILSLSGAICSYLGAPFGEKLFTSFRGALDCLIAIVASAATLFIILLAVFVKTVGGVLG